MEQLVSIITLGVTELDRSSEFYERLSDPDGFLWEVAWNPSFLMEEDGSIRIPD